MDVSHELGSIRHIVDSPLSSKVAMFNKVANQHKTSQLLNPFASVDGRCSPKPSFSKDEYGKPLAGSLTEQRGHKANLHIFKEIMELCQIIDSEGFIDEDNPDQKIIFFGDLFNIYNHISDKCVGLLLRARKHKFIEFEGEMLFQRRDDEVPIFMLKPYKEIRIILEEKQEEIKRAVSPAPQPTTLIGSNRSSPAHSPTPDKKIIELNEKKSAASLDFKPIREKSDLSVEIKNVPASAPAPAPKHNEKNDKIKAQENQVSQTNRDNNEDLTSSASIQILVEEPSAKNKYRAEDLLKSDQLNYTSDLSSSGSEQYLSNVTSTATCIKIPSGSSSDSNVDGNNSTDAISIKSGSIIAFQSSDSDSDTKTKMILEPKVKAVKSAAKSEFFDLESITSSQTNLPCLCSSNSETNTTIKSEESNHSLDALSASDLSNKQTTSDVRSVTQSQINLIDSSYNLQNGFGSDLSIGELDSQEVLISDVVVHYEPQNNSLSNSKLNSKAESDSKLENNSTSKINISETQLNDKLEPKENLENISSEHGIKIDDLNSKQSQSQLSNESLSETKSENLITNLEIKSTELSLSLDNKTQFIESQLGKKLEIKSEISPNINSELSENLYSLEKEEQHSIPVEVSP